MTEPASPPPPALTRVRPRRLVGFSTKMYFSLSRTEAYLTGLQDRLPSLPTSHIDIFILPDFLSIPTAQKILRRSNNDDSLSCSSDGAVPTTIWYGAQDAHWTSSGAHTGSVSPATLAEAGCRIVELGHAERRAAFGDAESDAVVARKAAAAVRHGLLPLVCVGERTRMQESSADDGSDDAAAVRAAVEECAVQLRPVLESIPVDADLALAYEPVWAIGAEAPADPKHVVGVVEGLRRVWDDAKSRGTSRGTLRILYGGSAGPGTWDALKDSVDGLFLGRFAHDVDRFVEVVREVAGV
ncbi:MAG: hypothetical protein M1825_001393 [Sarcosagium campestre]|nr:MAG: hypothetical protein M1825_001393 [Sarcosagium campestre]